MAISNMFSRISSPQACTRSSVIIVLMTVVCLVQLVVYINYDMVTVADSLTQNSICARVSVSRLRSESNDSIGIIFKRIANLSEQSRKEFLECAGCVISEFRKKFISGLPQTYEKCHKMSFQKSGPVVALASYPGSGNSWVRQLLESATGIYTGAIYCDKAYVHAGMIGENLKTQNVFAIKTHEKSALVLKNLKPDKVICIVRNPFEALLAEWCRYTHSREKQQHVHTLECVETKDLGNTSDWIAMVKNQSHVWQEMYEEWLNLKKIPILMIGYENLVKNTSAELRKILDFLKHPYTEDDIQCAVHNSALFHRNHIRRINNPYIPEMEKLVLNEIKKIDESLQKYNIYVYHTYKI